MEIYLVGGCVRDYILGRTPKDSDYLVVGATEDEFLQEFPDAKKVGASFPVFLVDGEEYAFARKERKVGRGHKGFVCDFGPEVTLFEDLQRRDLTINAVAMDGNGTIFMTPGAYEDFENKVLRHVSPAFTEDPLRVYRVARFAAELPDFSVHPDTLALMGTLRNELSSLPAERVWRETEKALRAHAPRRFFETLAQAGVLDVHFKELADLVDVPAGTEKHQGERDAFEHSMDVLERASTITECPETRWAAVCHDLGKGTTDPSEWPRHIGHDQRGRELAEDLSRRLRAPKKFVQSASLAAQAHMKGHRLPEMRPGKAVKFIKKLNRFPGGLEEFFVVLQADGTPRHVAQALLAKARAVLQVRLPAELHGLGKRSGERLLQLQAEKWKEADSNQPGTDIHPSPAGSVAVLPAGAVV